MEDANELIAGKYEFRVITDEERLLLITDFDACEARVIHEIISKQGNWIMVGVYHTDFEKVNDWHKRK